MTTTTPHERAVALLSRLTLDQKMAQVACYFPADINDTSEMAARYTHGVGHISTLEARQARTLDEVAAFQRRVQSEAMKASGHGIPAMFHQEGVCGAYLPGATSFPNGTARGAGWDPDLEERIGEIAGRQERALGITLTLAPVLDVTRDPRLGRAGESYGEDPTSVGVLGAAFTRGLQRSDAEGRTTEAVAKHFVGSHHVAGGIHGAHADIGPRLLREVYAKPFQAAITGAGLRGIMPCYNAIDGEPATASALLLDALLRGEMGFEGLVVSDYGAIGNLHTVQKVAATYAEAGMLALTAGVDAEFHVPQGIADDLRERFANGEADIALLDRAVLRVLEAKFRQGLFDAPFAPELPEREHAFAHAHDDAVSLQSARQSLVLLKNDGTLPLTSSTRRIAVIGCHADSARFFFGGYTHYSMAEGLLAVNSSMAGLTTAAADRREAERTVPGTSIEASDAPAFEELMQRHKPGIRSLVEELRARLSDCEVEWSYGYEIAGDDESGFEDALATAADADVVIMTLGGKHGTASIASMGEGVDATHIGLPPAQEALIERLATLGTPLVGVHLDGRPISSDVADRHLAAIVEAWSPAEHGAQAIVDILTGSHAPSGRLPVSVARNSGQVPICYNHPQGSAWHQGESVGFADYVDAPHTPRYPFGHGLTYTTFEYDGIEVSSAEVVPDGTVDVTVTVTNTGQRSGTEVVQLYASDRFASMTRPALDLLGFARVDLEPGETGRARFSVAASQLAFVGADGRWMVEAGDIDLYAGPSSAALPLEATVAVKGISAIDGASRSLAAGVRVG